MATGRFAPFIGKAKARQRPFRPQHFDSALQPNPLNSLHSVKLVAALRAILDRSQIKQRKLHPETA
jgi:hypothetical protein